ncbi:MAG TPA: ATP-binding protein [Candidatus Limnocylindrales bacterium]
MTEPGQDGRPPRRGRRRRADGGRGWWDMDAQGGPGAPPWAPGGPWNRAGQEWGPESPPWTQPGWAGPPRRWFVQRFAAVLIVLLIFVVILASVGGFVFASIFGLLGPDRPGQGGMVLTLRLGGVLLLVLGILFVAGRVRTITRPIDELVEATRRVTHGDYSVRVSRPRGRPRELVELAAGFNTMTERLETNERQRRSLLADVSHELRTPLAVVRGNVEAIVDGVHPADTEHLSAILDETLVLSRLVEDLRTVALSEAGTLPLHREPTDIGLLIDDVARSFETMTASAGVSIQVVASNPELPLLEIDPVRIREVLDNLVANALRYTPAGGRITISTARLPAVPLAQVEVSDTGSGIAPELADQLFDRFVKSSDSRGSGLGLAIARHLVEGHGGTISAESRPGQGTSIRFTLPLEPVPAA